MSGSAPFCPKCLANPALGQRKLTPQQRSGLASELLALVSVHSGRAYHCSTCSAVYAFENGVSTFLGYVTPP